jgi:hypothetical protein
MRMGYWDGMQKTQEKMFIPSFFLYIAMLNGETRATLG